MLTSFMPSIADLEKLLELDPTDAFVLYGLAQEHAKLGNTEAALSHYDRCLEADPAYCYAYYHKAVALKDAGRTDDAAATLRAGIEAATTHNDPKALGEITELLSALAT